MTDAFTGLISFPRENLREKEKLVLQKIAAQRLGLNVDTQRIYVSEFTTADQAAEMLALPVDPSNYSPLQTPAGESYFVHGYHSWFDGSTILLP